MTLLRQSRRQLLWRFWVLCAITLVVLLPLQLLTDGREPWWRPVVGGLSGVLSLSLVVVCVVEIRRRWTERN